MQRHNIYDVNTYFNIMDIVATQQSDICYASQNLLIVDVIKEEHYDKWFYMVHHGETREATNQFLTLLPGRGRQAYLWFCHILLTKAGQDFLYKDLGKLFCRILLLTKAG